MTSVLHKMSPQEVQSRLASGKAVLVDIREPDEYVRMHIPGAQSQPLSHFEQAHLNLNPDADVIFTCRTGMRTAGACDRLASRVAGEAYVLDGGLEAWTKAGLPLEINRKAPLELNRQVQIAAGIMILTGVLLGYLISSNWFALSAFIGLGLTFAGLTGTCGLARVLMIAPRNRRD